MWVPARSDAPEMLDRTDNDPAAIAAALENIRTVNRRLRGSRALLDAVDPFLDWLGDDETLAVLDIGTGGGDLVVDLAAHAASRGKRVRIVAIERDPAAAQAARRFAADRPEITVVEADAKALEYDEGSFDLVTASLVLHHFDDYEAVFLLRRLRKIARKAVIVNDLRRHLLPWLFIWIAARAARCHPMFVHDAPLSVLRGFTPAELLAIAEGAGAAGSTVQRRWPFRLVATLPAAGRAGSGRSATTMGLDG